MWPLPSATKSAQRERNVNILMAAFVATEKKPMLIRA
jgi:hypothetical protein